MPNAESTYDPHRPTYPPTTLPGKAHRGSQESDSLFYPGNAYMNSTSSSSSSLGAGYGASPYGQPPVPAASPYQKPAYQSDASDGRDGGRRRGPRGNKDAANDHLTRVIKNIPYNVTKEMLDHVLKLVQAPSYKSMYLLTDEMKQFRGMAFVTFAKEEDANDFAERVSGVEVDGRRLRVEDKKAASELPPRFNATAHPDYAAFLADLTTFTTDPTAHELQFPPTLDPGQRRVLHAIASDLGLTHRSEGQGNERYIIVGRASDQPPQQLYDPLMRSSGLGAGTPPINETNLVFRERRAFNKNNNAEQNGANNGLLQPIRQPKGPEENSIGFTLIRSVI